MSDYTYPEFFLGLCKTAVWQALDEGLIAPSAYVYGLDEHEETTAHTAFLPFDPGRAAISKVQDAGELLREKSGIRVLLESGLVIQALLDFDDVPPDLGITPPFPVLIISGHDLVSKTYYSHVLRLVFDDKARIAGLFAFGRQAGNDPDDNILLQYLEAGFAKGE